MGSTRAGIPLPDNETWVVVWTPTADPFDSEHDILVPLQDKLIDFVIPVLPVISTIALAVGICVVETTGAIGVAVLIGLHTEPLEVIIVIVKIAVRLLGTNVGVVVSVCPRSGIWNVHIITAEVTGVATVHLAGAHGFTISTAITGTVHAQRGEGQLQVEPSLRVPVTVDVDVIVGIGRQEFVLDAATATGQSAAIIIGIEERS